MEPDTGLFFFFFDRLSVLAVPKLALQIRLVLYSVRSTYLCLLSPGIKCMLHHHLAWYWDFYLIKCGVFETALLLFMEGSLFV